MKIVLQNTTDWPDDLLKVVLRWVAKQAGRKTPFRVKIRNGKRWHCSYGQTISVTVPKRHEQKFPPTNWSGNFPAFQSRLQLIVWSVAWCLQTDCTREDRNTLANYTLNRFCKKQHKDSLMREMKAIIKNRKEEKPKVKTPIRCARYSAALRHVDKWERKLKLAQTKVKKYQAIAARYEREFAKENAGGC